MPSHSKPVVSDDGSSVSVSINPQTLITIFGVNMFIHTFRRETHRCASSPQVATSAYKQKVQAELQDANSAVQSSSTFDGVQKESLYLESDSTKKAIVWGPFDAQMTLKLSFSHQDDDSDSDDSDTDDADEPSWVASSVIVDKVKEASNIF